LHWTACFAVLAVVAAPAGAQSAPPAGGIDSDLARPDEGNAPPPPPQPETAPPPPAASPPPGEAPYPAPPPSYAPQAGQPYAPQAGQPYAPQAQQPYANAQPMAYGPTHSMCGRPTSPGGTYQSADLIGAAEGVFGKGSRGLASLIRDILSKQGTPDGYIAGREAGGAFAVGLRYGSGTLCQKVQEPLPVFWTGPSIGFDAGANAAKTFVLVYNLDNRDDLFHRFGAGEGQAYFVGGFNVSYLRRGNVVLIPVRVGVGLRLGINGGYMKISRHQNWMPF
jgi:hypothetical protein